MRNRRWIVVLAIIGLSAVVGIRWFMEYRSAQMRQAADRVRADLDATTRERPVAWGQERAGRAWDGYARALQSFAAAEESATAIGGGKGVEDWLHAPAKAGVACWQRVQILLPTFALLREAAHRTDVTATIDFETSHWGPALALTQSLDCTRYLALRAWQLGRDDEDLEAVRTLLDLLQFSRDQLDQPGYSGLGPAATELAVRLFFVSTDERGVEHPARWRIEDLSHDSLRVLRAGLARLDRPLPTLGDLMRFTALCCVYDASTWKRSFHADLTTAMGQRAWSSVFFGELTWSTAVLDYLECAEGFSSEQSWGEVEARCIEISSSELSYPCGNVFAMARPLRRVEVGRRTALVCLRALRLLVDDALGEPGSYVDPFGSRMQKMHDGAHSAETRPRYWSVGEDGVGQGGNPGTDIVFQR